MQPLIPLRDIENPEVAVLAARARSFLDHQSWCEEVTGGSLAFAIAGVLGVFKMTLRSSRPDVPDTLWVVAGDLPAAYLVPDRIENWQQALELYVDEMRRWVNAVRDGGSLDDVIPVKVAPTVDHAEMIEGRLQIIEKNLIGVPADEIDADH